MLRTLWETALGRFRPLWALAGVYLSLSVILRLVLWTRFGTASQVPWTDLPAILGLGAINDLVELIYLLTPLTVYLLLVSQRWVQRRWHTGLMALGLYLTLFGMVYLFVVEYFFFEEFDARMNLVAVDYLIYPHEVLVNIWDSYPVAQVLITSAVLALLLLRLIWPTVRVSRQQAAPFRQRVGFAAVYGLALTAAISLYFTHGLDFSENRVANEIVANGPSSFFEALRTSEMDYYAYYRTLPPARATRLVKADLASATARFVAPDGPSLDRHHPKTADGLGPLNIVVIAEESFGARYVASYGSQWNNLTPEFDRLAAQGWQFTNTYATGTRTVRGLEAISASFPPIPSVSIIKRPGNQGLANWSKVMAGHGYAASFLYGGYGAFDNMNEFFSHNGYAISDRTDIEEVHFSNIWGVSDQDLFRHALGYYDRHSAAGKPFFSLIMTTSNHKPYTFPAGVPGVPTEGGGRLAGIRYADYALGWFIREAESHDWFRNTLFIVVADHGARVYGRAQIPMRSYEIPLVFYSPAHLSPRRIEALTSQLDIAPTALGLLGLEYTAPFFGRDVIHETGRKPMLLLNHNHKVALYRDGRMAVLGLQKWSRTYAYDRVKNTFQALPEDRDLTDLTTAFYQTAYDQFEKHEYE